VFLSHDTARLRRTVTTHNDKNIAVDSIAKQLLTPNNTLQATNISFSNTGKDTLQVKVDNNQFDKLSPNDLSQDNISSSELTNNVPTKASKKNTKATTVLAKNSTVNDLNNSPKISTTQSLVMNKPSQLATEKSNEITTHLTMLKQNSLSASNKVVPNLNKQSEFRKFKASTSAEDKVAHVAQTIDLLSNPVTQSNISGQSDIVLSQSQESETKIKATQKKFTQLNLASNNATEQQVSNLNLSLIQNADSHKNPTPAPIWNMAKQLKSVDPVYPSLAKRKGIEIEVKVHFTIDEHGQVKNIKFAQRSKVNYFKSAIRAAIRKWRFSPATKNEQAIESQMSKIFSFSLSA
jgi:TonB family protein